MTRPYADDDWGGRRTIVKNDGLRSAEGYVYGGTGNSDRQRCFYRILLKMYDETGNSKLPVVIPGCGQKWRMDVGCVIMAVHYGVLRPLKNAPSGYVEAVELKNPERLKELWD